MASKELDLTPPKSASVAKMQQASVLDSPSRVTRYQLRRMSAIGTSATENGTPETSSPSVRRSTRSRHSVAGFYSEDSDAGSIQSEPAGRSSGAARRSTRASSQQPRSPPKPEVKRTRRNSLSNVSSTVTTRSTRNRPRLSPVPSEEMSPPKTPPKQPIGVSPLKPSTKDDAVGTPRKLFAEEKSPTKAEKPSEAASSPTATKEEVEDTCRTPTNTKRLSLRLGKSPKLAMKTLEQKLGPLFNRSRDGQLDETDGDSVKAATPKSKETSEGSNNIDHSPNTPGSAADTSPKNPESGVLNISRSSIRIGKSPECQTSVDEFEKKVYSPETNTAAQTGKETTPLSESKKSVTPRGTPHSVPTPRQTQPNESGTESSPQTPKDVSKPCTRAQTPLNESGKKSAPQTPQETPKDVAKSSSRAQTPLNESGKKSAPQTPQETPKDVAKSCSRAQTPLNESGKKSAPQTPQETPKDVAKSCSQAQTPLNESGKKSAPQTPKDVSKPCSRAQTPLNESGKKSAPQTPQETPKDVAKSCSRAQTPLNESGRKSAPQTPQQTPKDVAKPCSRAQTPLNESGKKSAPQTPQQTPKEVAKPRSRAQTPLSESTGKAATPQSRSHTPLNESSKKSAPQTPEEPSENVITPLSRNQTQVCESSKEVSTPRTRSQTPQSGSEEKVASPLSRSQTPLSKCDRKGRTPSESSQARSSPLESEKLKKGSEDEGVAGSPSQNFRLSRSQTPSESTKSENVSKTPAGTPTARRTSADEAEERGSPKLGSPPRTISSPRRSSRLCLRNSESKTDEVKAVVLVGSNDDVEDRSQVEESKSIETERATADKHEIEKLNRSSDSDEVKSVSSDEESDNAGRGASERSREVDVNDQKLDKSEGNTGSTPGAEGEKKFKASNEHREEDFTGQPEQPTTTSEGEGGVDSEDSESPKDARDGESDDESDEEATRVVFETKKINVTEETDEESDGEAIISEIQEIEVDDEGLQTDDEETDEKIAVQVLEVEDSDDEEEAEVNVEEEEDDSEEEAGKRTCAFIDLEAEEADSDEDEDYGVDDDEEKSAEEDSKEAVGDSDEDEESEVEVLRDEKTGDGTKGDEDEEVDVEGDEEEELDVDEEGDEEVAGGEEDEEEIDEEDEVDDEGDEEENNVEQGEKDNDEEDENVAKKQEDEEDEEDDIAEATVKQVSGSLESTSVSKPKSPSKTPAQRSSLGTAKNADVANSLTPILLKPVSSAKGLCKSEERRLNVKELSDKRKSDDGRFKTLSQSETRTSKSESSTPIIRKSVTASPKKIEVSSSTAVEESPDSDSSSDVEVLESMNASGSGNTSGSSHKTDESEEGLGTSRETPQKKATTPSSSSAPTKTPVTEIQEATSTVASTKTPTIISQSSDKKKRSKRRGRKFEEAHDSDYDFNLLDDVPEKTPPRKNSFQVKDKASSPKSDGQGSQIKRKLNFVVRKLKPLSSKRSTNASAILNNSGVWSIAPCGNYSKLSVQSKMKKTKMNSFHVKLRDSNKLPSATLDKVTDKKSKKKSESVTDTDLRNIFPSTSDLTSKKESKRTVQLPLEVTDLRNKLNASRKITSQEKQGEKNSEIISDKPSKKKKVTSDIHPVSILPSEVSTEKHKKNKNKKSSKLSQDLTPAVPSASSVKDSKIPKLVLPPVESDLVEDLNSEKKSKKLKKKKQPENLLADSTTIDKAERKRKVPCEATEVINEGIKVKKAKTENGSEKKKSDYTLSTTDETSLSKKEKKKKALQERLQRTVQHYKQFSTPSSQSDDEAPTAMSFSQSRQIALEEESRKSDFLNEKEKDKKEKRKLKQLRILEQKAGKVKRKAGNLEEESEKSVVPVVPTGKKTYFNEFSNDRSHLPSSSKCLDEAGPSQKKRRTEGESTKGRTSLDRDNKTSERERKRKERGLAELLKRRQMVEAPFIPVEAPTGATRFGVVPLKNLNNDKNRLAEDAANFRNQMLFGSNRIRRTPLVTWQSQMEKKKAGRLAFTSKPTQFE